MRFPIYVPVLLCASQFCSPAVHHVFSRSISKSQRSAMDDVNPLIENDKTTADIQNRILRWKSVTVTLLNKFHYQIVLFCSVCFVSLVLLVVLSFLFTGGKAEFVYFQITPTESTLHSLHTQIRPINQSFLKLSGISLLNSPARFSMSSHNPIVMPTPLPVCPISRQDGTCYQ